MTIEYGTIDLPKDEFDPKYTKISVSVVLDGDVLDAVKAAADSLDVDYKDLINETLRVVYITDREKV